MLGGGDNPPDGSQQSRPAAEDVRSQLERLVASPDLDLPLRGRKFLRYIVEETLAGRADRIKAYSVGTEVFGRDANFDAQVDPVVRLEASRLRRALEHYYLVAGLSDHVVIDVPKGAYVPRFALRAVRTAPAVTVSYRPSPAVRMTADGADMPPRPPKPLWIGLSGVVLAAAVSGFAWWSTLQQLARPAPSLALVPSGPTLVVMPFANLGDSPE